MIPTGLLWHLSAGEVAVPIATSHLILIGGGVVFGAIGYLCIVKGMRLGEASVVAPFRYSRILFAMLVGAVVFDERVDAIALVGIGLIVSAGLYSFEREAKKVSGRER